VAGEWDQRKPIQGDLKPDAALAALATFEGRFARLQQEHAQVARAKEALNLELSGADRVAPLLEELQDLKGVWAELTRVWQGIQELADTMWSAVAPRKVRGRLDTLLTELKDLPARLRQYAAYEHVQATLRYNSRPCGPWLAMSPED
jgi:dynein heavy chain 1, cytosolic